MADDARYIPDELDPETDAATSEDDEGAGLYEHFAVTADKGQTLLRLDKFLTARMEHCSRNRIQAAADSGNILVNGRPAKSSYKVKPLDRIQIVMPYPRRDTEIKPEDIPLEIPYEDDDLLIVNKPAGMVVHPGVGNWDGTLVNALTYHLRTLPMFREGDLRAGLVHRIDKDTSGLLVVAKNERAHARLAKQFFDHTIVRRYYEQDTWKENLIFEEESFDLLQEILEQAGELEKKASYKTLVTTKYAEEAAAKG